MNCEVCKGKGYIKGYNDEERICPLCRSSGKVTFHRHIQWHVGDVLLLSSRHDGDASISEMNYRCKSIIEREFKKYGKSRLPVIKSFSDEGYKVDSVVVRDFYIRQFDDR